MITVEHRPPVSILWLDRPDRRNALTPQMLSDLVAHLRSIPATTRALVLAGRGETFCAGFDLTVCRDDSTGSVLRDLLQGLSAAIVALAELPIPVVVACRGAAVAGGCALLGGADVVVANAAAKLGYPVVRLGISPAVSGPFLVRSVPLGRVTEWFLNPTLVSGEEARGLVHEVVPEPDQVLPRVLAIAETLASKPAPAMAMTKAWMRELGRLDGLPDAPLRALQVSLSLVGGEEERAMLPLAWSR